ncbi:cell division protein FtsN [Novosphingobium hassiacum]|uniref:Cell division protein FtsN n=1 Tax=Novosphingobium hassiacum TaxID=173676 RepID=A0A7W6EV01_9SPHN|nr:cell division protein FtsN [Novosphingobium hassiacum]
MTLPLGFALALAAAPASADVKTGVDAWSRGEYELAIKEWLGPAAKGDADAQFNMGQAYKLGKGVTLDMKRAEAWYRKAAAQGHVKAADTLGLVLFQQDRKTEALPFIQAAAERGEPRAQYILGIAHFNGDLVGKDWVRAYALMSRASAAGLEQATRSLATMDGIVPLEQRQLAMSLSAELEQKAQENRSRQFAAADLGVRSAPTAPLRPAQSGAPLERTELPPSTRYNPAPPSVPSGPVTAGADFANPVTMQQPKRIAVAPALQTKPPAKPAVVPAPKPTAQPAAKPRMAAPAPAPAAKGNWRVQLGAFGVKSNADSLWAKVRGRAELAGHGRIDLASGSVTRLLAGGFATLADADKACAALKSGGFTCLVVRP